MSEPVQALVVVDTQRGLLAGPRAVVGAAALTQRRSSSRRPRM
ncbi:MAG TPA: hypothetical protein VNC85_05835 [Mycobacteriales bacterium]|nr:hypothetical protein [Mycobacteriales bacterium]